MTNATSYDIYASSAEDLSRVRERLFARTMDRIFAAHPYYRQVFKESGISREDIRIAGRSEKNSDYDQDRLHGCPAEVLHGPGRRAR